MNLRLVGIGLAGVTAALAFLSGYGSRAGNPPVINVASGDAEMDAARAKARRTIAMFWAAMDARQQDTRGFALKVAIPHGQGHEHFWLTDVVRHGDRYRGTINNEPRHARQVRLGERYEFGDAEISDWMFMRGGKIVGNETMRPLLQRMPQAQAEQYRAMLETP